MMKQTRALKLQTLLTRVLYHHVQYVVPQKLSQTQSKYSLLCWRMQKLIRLSDQYQPLDNYLTGCSNGWLAKKYIFCCCTIHHMNMHIQSLLIINQENISNEKYLQDTEQQINKCGLILIFLREKSYGFQPHGRIFLPR